MIDPKKFKPTKGKWTLDLVGRGTICDLIASIARQDQAIILRSDVKDDGTAPIIAILPTATKKPGKEDWSNAYVLEIAMPLALMVAEVCDDNPELWKDFIASVVAWREQNKQQPEASE